jgi:hypothetical protein
MARLMSSLHFRRPATAAPGGRKGTGRSHLNGHRGCHAGTPAAQRGGQVPQDRRAHPRQVPALAAGPGDHG